MPIEITMISSYSTVAFWGKHRSIVDNIESRCHDIIVWYSDILLAFGTENIVFSEVNKIKTEQKEVQTSWGQFWRHIDGL